MQKLLQNGIGNISSNMLKSCIVCWNFKNLQAIVKNIMKPLSVDIFAGFLRKLILVHLNNLK